MSQFAFKVSVPDLFRKIRYRYENPLDYLDNVVSQLYSPGNEVKINLTKNQIRVESPAEIPLEFFVQLYQGNVAAVASMIPPSADYREVRLVSGGAELAVDENRSLRINEADYNGTRLQVTRDNAQIDSETSRLKTLYGGSDLLVAINGKDVNGVSENSHDFCVNGFRGILGYNPNSLGGVHYYFRGRYVSSQELASAIDVRLFEHGFTPTITKSRMITSGAAELHKLESFLPGLFYEYLSSDEVMALRRKSEVSYQTLMNSALQTFPDEPRIAELAEKTIGVNFETLVIASSLIGVTILPREGIEDFMFHRGTLFASTSLSPNLSPLQVATMAIPYISKNPKDEMQRYKHLVKEASS